jgi:RNA polymerase sigma-70 factor (ECF subfamily)
MSRRPLERQLLEHRDALLALIYALTRDYDAAEEIFQEVALNILEEASRGTIVDHFLAWARQVARHRVIDYYRRDAKRAAREQPSGSMADVITEAFRENEITPQASQQRMKALLECLNRLTGRARQVIEGFYRQRKSLKALAADLGWKEDSVKVALSRARKVLADCVASRVRGQEAG